MSGGLGRLHRGCRRLSGVLGSLLEVMGKLPGECGELFMCQVRAGEEWEDYRDTYLC